MEQLLTSEEVAKILRVAERTIKYKLNIPFVKIGNKRMYQTQDVENFIKKNKKYTIDCVLVKRQYVV